MSQVGQRQYLGAVVVLGGWPFSPVCRVAPITYSSRSLGVKPSFRENRLSVKWEFSRCPPSSYAVDLKSEDIRQESAWE